jgi:signal transduction histidine kinase
VVGRRARGRRPRRRWLTHALGGTRQSAASPTAAGWAAVIDITTRKAAEVEAERHRAELAHVARIATMGELPTALARELNQPLTAILADAQTVQEWLASPSLDLRMPEMTGLGPLPTLFLAFPAAFRYWTLVQWRGSPGVPHHR